MIDKTTLNNFFDGEENPFTKKIVENQINEIEADDISLSSLINLLKESQLKNDSIYSIKIELFADSSSNIQLLSIFDKIVKEYESDDILKLKDNLLKMKNYEILLF